MFESIKHRQQAFCCSLTRGRV